MEIPDQIPGKAIRWDTSENRIYFDIEQGMIKGILVVAKNADGKTDLFIADRTAGKPA